MKQDRFLFGILIGIAALIVFALAFFFIRPSTLKYGSEDTPDGVVRNYLVALYQQDYDRAYGYLAEAPYKPTLDQFIQPFLLNYVSPSAVGVEIMQTSISGEQASVQLSVIYNPSDPFSGGYRNTENALLVRENSQWKIKQMPGNFWYYEWYQEDYQVTP